MVWLHEMDGWVFSSPAVAVEGADFRVGQVHFGAGEDDLPLRVPEHTPGIELVEPFWMLLPLDHTVRHRPRYACRPTRRWMQTRLDVFSLKFDRTVVVCVGLRVVHAR